LVFGCLFVGNGLLMVNGWVFGGML
jgi:hypothetical protein